MLRQPARKFTRDLLERHHVSRTGRAFDLERFAVKEVITLERFDDEKIDREPNRSAPVRVAAEKIAGSLTRDIVDAMFFVARAEDVGLLAMDARNGAQAMRREKFVFVEHVAQARAANARVLGSPACGCR